MNKILKLQLYFISRSGEKCFKYTKSPDKEDSAYYVTKDFNFKNPPINARQGVRIIRNASVNDSFEDVNAEISDYMAPKDQYDPADHEYDYTTQQDLHLK